MKVRATLLLAAAAAILQTASSAFAALSINTSNASEWTATNGIVTLGMSTSSGSINQLTVTINGTTTNIFNTTDSSGLQLYGEYDGPTGIMYGSTTASYHFDSGHYLDIWTTTAPSSTSDNFGIQTHWVLTANSPDLYMYTVFTHSASAPATNLGQGQFIFKAGDTVFNSIFQANTGPHNFGAFNYTLPTEYAQGQLVAGTPGRQVLPEVIDYTGLSSPGNPNDPHFIGKYDFSTYEQYHTITGEYTGNLGANSVAAWFVNPSTETLTNGPTKQSIVSGSPVIPQLLDEFISAHYGGGDYVPPQGVNSSRLFGPFALHFNAVDPATPNLNSMYQDAANSAANDLGFFNYEGILLANGYIPDSKRGNLQPFITDTLGWSGNANNNVVVLSDPGKDFQQSANGYQYWGYLNSSGNTTLYNVVPGTYRLTAYQPGQWGEMRLDNVAITSGQTNALHGLTFTPENFGTAAPIWTIGTPDHSANEFENGHNSAGQDDRQYSGAYNYWQELSANQGKVVYYATAVGSNAATNNLNVWPANQWQYFDPGLYAGVYNSNDKTTDGYKYIAPSYVTNAGGPGSYTGQPWEIHFTTTSAQQAQGQYVVLSVALAASESDLIVNLNGHQLIMKDPYYIHASDPMIRSGDAGYYGWAALQFPTSDLNPPGQDNVITLSVNHSWGVMYDALRLEITNTSADPAVTGWHDYEFLYGNTDTFPNDTLGQN